MTPRVTAFALIGLTASFALSCKAKGSSDVVADVGRAQQAISHNSYVPAGYRCVWHDEFGGAVGHGQSAANYDPAFWETVGTDVNNELQGYTRRDCVSRPNDWNICVRDGMLTLRARKDAIDCTLSGGQTADPTCAEPWGTSVGKKAYTSGRLHTKHKVDKMYGYIETRARLPQHNRDVPESGIWPAIWMLGANIKGGPPPGDVEWPGCGEFDIVEWRTKGTTSMMGYNAIWLGADGNLDACGIWPEGGSSVCGPCSGGPCTGARRNGDRWVWDGWPGFPHKTWHTYAVLWTATEITVLIDGAKMSTMRLTDSESELKQPMFLIVNLAIGGNLGGPVEITDWSELALDVDYIRWYQQGAADRCGTPTR